MPDPALRVLQGAAWPVTSYALAAAHGNAHAVARFTVPGVPTGKGRARSSPTGHYTPKTTRDAETVVAWSFRQGVIDRSLLLRPELSYALIMVACFQKRPKRDNDNLEKLVMDALNGICWKDDAQVMHNETDKVLGAAYDGTLVLIRAWR